MSLFIVYYILLHHVFKQRIEVLTHCTLLCYSSWESNRVSNSGAVTRLLEGFCFNMLYTGRKHPVHACMYVVVYLYPIIHMSSLLYMCANAPWKIHVPCIHVCGMFGVYICMRVYVDVEA